MADIVTGDIERIKRLLKNTLGTSIYKSVERLGGLTNHTYKVCLVTGKDYIVRIPGEGTEEMIVRSDEKVSTELACSLGIDAKLIYFGNDGSKVTDYIDDAETMSSTTLKQEDNIKRMADIFNKLHQCGKDTRVPFEVFDMASTYEKVIFDNNVNMYCDYDDIKNTVMEVKSYIDTTHVIEKVPCHNDALCENWVLSKDRMYLIDWEYAGMNDAIWDLADVSIEAGFNKDLEGCFLEKYYGRVPTKSDWERFLANKIYVDFLWTLWAKTRVPFDGQTMEDWASERYDRLKESINEFKEIKDGNV